MTDKNTFSSRNFHLMMLISQSIGLSGASIMPRCAILSGPLGFSLCHMLTCIVLGIPLLYMELIIGQFTALNSLEVWQVRPFLSHIGHVLVFFQILCLFSNHVVGTFVIHYLFISFQNPKPYYTCGKWADENCGIVATNFTINEDCVRSGPKYSYCDNLYKTFPEVQYYQKIVAIGNEGPRIDWNLCLPSAIFCILLYISCFKRRHSMQWFLGVMTIYPAVSVATLMLGSMLQKGILIHYQDAMDITFERFFSEFDFFNLLPLVVYTTSLGSGLVVNVGASCHFRAPCYANAVMTMATNVAFHLVLVVTTAMMICPYSFAKAVAAERTADLPLAHVFERIPAMIQEYDNTSFWVSLTYTCYACLGLRTSILSYYHLLEVFCKKFSRVAQYPGLVSFCVSALLFILTMPFLGSLLRLFLSKPFRRCIQLVPVIVVIMECFVFIICYGLERFSEDVHFMQGIRPSNLMKLSWFVSSILLVYVCFKELFDAARTPASWELIVGVVIFGVSMLYIFGMALVKVAVAWRRKEAAAAVRLSDAWRPRSELLQRSRAMFTAQAMTKEYLYRQYHLQAGILARQLRANRTRIVNTQV